MHSPAAKGLFQFAIMESGSCYASVDPLASPDKALRGKAAMLQKLNLSDAELKALPISQLRQRLAKLRDRGFWGVGGPLWDLGLGMPSGGDAILPELPTKANGERLLRG